MKKVQKNHFSSTLSNFMFNLISFMKICFTTNYVSYVVRFNLLLLFINYFPKIIKTNEICNMPQFGQANYLTDI